MVIKTWEIDRADGDYRFNYTEELSYLANEQQQVVEISPVTVQGQITQQDDFYYVTGSVQVAVTYDCSRCLERFTCQEESSFEEIFLDEEQAGSLDEEQSYTIIEDNLIHIRPLVEETVAMLIPYIPLCTADCKGLCAQCGIDLNEKACECSHERIDPRLAGLADWFNKE